MSMQDTVADMLTRIKNAQMIGHKKVTMPSSKVKANIAKVLADEGYVESYEVDELEPKKSLTIKLKYFHGKPVIDEIKRVSRPGLRVYKSKDDIPTVKGGLGIVIISSSKGIMTDRQARAIGQGGEVICTVA